MLRLKVPSREYFDEEKQEFVTTKEFDLQLEHSLVSLAKWESKWHKAFMGKAPKTTEETLDYVRCMTVSQNRDQISYKLIPPEVLDQIREYIEDSMTATTFSKPEEKVTSKETVTAELIYYWMITFNIPAEYQKWHLNRLLTLINVCSIKNQPPKKMTLAERKKALIDRKRLNDQRKAAMNTKG